MTLIPNSIHTARFTKIMTKPPEDMEWDDARDQVQRTYTWLRRARQAPPGDDLLDELSRADAVATACSALREALVVFGALTYTPGESHNEHNQLHSTPPPPQSIGELDAPNSELDTATSPEREPGTTPPDTTPVTAGALSELQQALNNRAFEGELSDTMIYTPLDRSCRCNKPVTLPLTDLAGFATFRQDATTQVGRFFPRWPAGRAPQA